MWTIQLKEGLKRGNHTIKCYVPVFICLAVKAIHLKLVTNLSTDAFIRAFQRFTPWRGTPIKIYSDNATNFTGANNKFIEQTKLVSSSEFHDKIMTVTVDMGIQWEFSPAVFSHFNGLQEATFKFTKIPLKKSDEN